MISSHHTHNTRGRMYSSSAAAAAEGLATDFEPSASAKALAFKALASAAERVAMDSPPADAAAEASAEDGAETGARPRRLSGSAVRLRRLVLTLALAILTPPSPSPSPNPNPNPNPYP